MKKRVICLLLALMVSLSPALSLLCAAYNGDTLVYVTKTGECYHRDGCSYLKSRIEITLKDAISKGYRPCSRCDPPLLDYSDASSESSGIKTYSSSSGNIVITYDADKEAKKFILPASKDEHPSEEPISKTLIISIGVIAFGGICFAAGRKSGKKS